MSNIRVVDFNISNLSSNVSRQNHIITKFKEVKKNLKEFDNVYSVISGKVNSKDIYDDLVENVKQYTKSKKNVRVTFNLENYTYKIDKLNNMRGGNPGNENGDGNDQDEEDTSTNDEDETSNGQVELANDQGELANGQVVTSNGQVVTSNGQGKLTNDQGELTNDQGELANDKVITENDEPVAGQFLNESGQPVSGRSNKFVTESGQPQYSQAVSSVVPADESSVVPSDVSSDVSEVVPAEVSEFVPSYTSGYNNNNSSTSTTYSNSLSAMASRFFNNGGNKDEYSDTSSEDFNADSDYDSDDSLTSYTKNKTYLLDSDSDDDESLIENAKYLKSKKYLNSLTVNELKQLMKKNNMRVSINGSYYRKNEMIKLIQKNK